MDSLRVVGVGRRATLNALWPVRRPWWLKLPSFNAGWFANELPVHLLAGHTGFVVVLAALGAFDGRPGSIGGPITADGDGTTGPSVPRSWLVWPWLAWSRAPGVEPVAGVVYSIVAGRSLELDVYRPAGRRHGCPVLVEIHGGGWITVTAGSKRDR